MLFLAYGLLVASASAGRTASIVSQQPLFSCADLPSTSHKVNCFRIPALLAVNDSHIFAFAENRASKTVQIMSTTVGARGAYCNS